MEGGGALGFFVCPWCAPSPPFIGGQGAGGGRPAALGRWSPSRTPSPPFLWEEEVLVGLLPSQFGLGRELESH